MMTPTEKAMAFDQWLMSRAAQAERRDDLEGAAAFYRAAEEFEMRFMEGRR